MFSRTLHLIYLDFFANKLILGWAGRFFSNRRFKNIFWWHEATTEVFLSTIKFYVAKIYEICPLVRFGHNFNICKDDLNVPKIWMFCRRRANRIFKMIFHQNVIYEISGEYISFIKKRAQDGCWQNKIHATEFSI